MSMPKLEVTCNKRWHHRYTLLYRPLTVLAWNTMPTFLTSRLHKKLPSSIITVIIVMQLHEMPFRELRLASNPSNTHQQLFTFIRILLTTHYHGRWIPQGLHPVRCLPRPGLPHWLVVRLEAVSGCTRETEWKLSIVHGYSNAIKMTKIPNLYFIATVVSASFTRCCSSWVAFAVCGGRGEEKTHEEAMQAGSTEHTACSSSENTS